MDHRAIPLGERPPVERPPVDEALGFLFLVQI